MRHVLFTWLALEGRDKACELWFEPLLLEHVPGKLCECYRGLFCGGASFNVDFELWFCSRTSDGKSYSGGWLFDKDHFASNHLGVWVCS